MNKKIICFIVSTLLILTALPVIGITEKMEDFTLSSENNNCDVEQLNSNINPTFIRTWGTTEEDYARHAEIHDGYIYLCGYCNYDGETGDVYLLKYDTSGSLIWDRIWDGGGYESLYYVTIYNGYIYATGSTDSLETRGLDLLLLKYDLDGELIWAKFWGGIHDENGYEIIPYDNYLYISGRTWSYGSGDSDGLLIKFDTDGNEIWYKTYGGSGYDELAGITEYNGDLYITGDRDNYASSILLKYKTNGDLVYEKQWSNETVQFGNAIIVCNNNIYITGGAGNGIGSSDSLNITLQKISMDGILQWEKMWSQGDFRNWGYDLDSTDDYIYVTGRTCTVPTYISDLVLLKYDHNGNLQWGKTWGGEDSSSHEYGRSVQVYNDYLYISGGTFTIPFDSLLFKCDLEGEQGNTNPIKPNAPSGKSGGRVGKEYTYSTSTIDEDGDQLKFQFNWGDGNTSWTDWIDSGTSIFASHTWTEKGTFNITVKSRDKKGGDSEWSDPLSVNIPRNRVKTNLFFLRFLERFPLIEKLLSFIFI